MRVHAALVAMTLAAHGGAAAAEDVLTAPGALIRGLDKVTGTTTDLALSEGETGRIGRLSITLGQCRYPAADPSSNAYAWLLISDDLVTAGPVFEGWMIAAAPALNALDHSRYDVWLIRCSMSNG